MGPYKLSPSQNVAEDLIVGGSCKRNQNHKTKKLRNYPRVVKTSLGFRVRLHTLALQLKKGLLNSCIAGVNVKVNIT